MEFSWLGDHAGAVRSLTNTSGRPTNVTVAPVWSSRYSWGALASDAAATTQTASRKKAARDRCAAMRDHSRRAQPGAALPAGLPEDLPATPLIPKRPDLNEGTCTGDTLSLRGSTSVAGILARILRHSARLGSDHHFRSRLDYGGRGL